MSDEVIIVRDKHLLFIQNHKKFSLHCEEHTNNLAGIESSDATLCDQLHIAFNADHSRICDSLQPSQIYTSENLSCDELFDVMAAFVVSEPQEISCAKIIIVESMGILIEGIPFILCADGHWISIFKIAATLSETIERSPIIVLVHAIETEEAVTLVLDSTSTVQTENLILFWDICPFNTLFCNVSGSLFMQVIANQFQTRAENSTVQEMLLSSKDIVDWYIASRQDCEETESIGGQLRTPCSKLIGNLPPCRIEPLIRVFQPAFAPTGNTLIDNHGALVPSTQWQTCSIHTHEVKVTVTTRTEGAEIHYTMDESIPSRESRRYKKPILLSHNGVGYQEFVIKAIAFKDGMQPSRIGVSPLYRVQAQTRPVIFSEIRSGDEVLLSMSSETPGSLIFFESGDAELTGKSSMYREPIRLHTKLIRAFARADGMTDSVVTNYELKAQAEVPSIIGSGELRLSSELDETRRNVFLDLVTVEMRSSAIGVDGCRCYYHIQTESSEPKLALPQRGAETSGYGRCLTRYLGPVVLRGAGIHRVTAYAIANGAADSDLAEAVFEVQQQVEPVIVTPASGSFKLFAKIAAHSDTGGSGIVADGRHLLPKRQSSPAPAGPLAQVSLSAAAAAAATAAVGTEKDRYVIRQGLLIKPSGGLELILDRRDDALFAADGLLAGKSLPNNDHVTPH